MFCEYSSGSLSVSSPNREAVTEKEYSKIKKSNTPNKSFICRNKLLVNLALNK